MDHLSYDYWGRLVLAVLLSGLLRYSFAWALGPNYSGTRTPAWSKSRWGYSFLFELIPAICLVIIYTLFYWGENSSFQSLGIGIVIGYFGSRLLISAWPPKDPNTGGILLRQYRLVIHSVLSVLVVISLIFLPAGVEAPTGWPGSFLASWLASVLFFLVAGALLALYSVKSPEDAVFDDRLRMLVGKASEKAFSYISSQVREKSIYYKSVHKDICFLEVRDDASGVRYYKVKQQVKYVISSMLVDVEASDDAKFSLKTDNGKISGWVKTAEAGGKPLIDPSNPREIAPGETIEIPFKIEIKPGTTFEAIVWFETWLSTKESQDLAPSRFTESMTLSFRSEIHGNPPILIEKTNGKTVDSPGVVPVPFATEENSITPFKLKELIPQMPDSELKWRFKC